MKSQKIRRRVIEGMRKKGFKLTHQRFEVIDVLARQKSHPSAHDVFVRARKKAPTISLSTVYLTLDILEREGLIKELEFADCDNRYEGDISDHVNLVCKRCGKIIDLKAPLPVPLENVEKKTGFKVEGVRYECYGYCKPCRMRKH